MLQMLRLTLLGLTFTSLSLCVVAADPTPPGLTFVATIFLDTTSNAAPSLQGPVGVREYFAITGGNITGADSEFFGTVLAGGADWILADPQTDLVQADGRFAFATTDGDFVFVTGKGPTRADLLGTHLHIKFETGSRDLYWLNEILAVGVLSQAATNATDVVRRIDVWHLTDEFTSSSTVLLS